MTVLFTVLAALAAAPASVLAVRAGTEGSRQAITVLASAALVEATVHREGNEVVISLVATALPTLEAPSALAPIEAIRLEPLPDRLLVHVRVSPDVPHEVRREGSLFTVLFGHAETGAEATARTDLAELYKKIFPAAREEVPRVTSAEGEERAESGLPLGPFQFHPSFLASYVDAASTVLDTPQPVHDHYFQIVPNLGLGLSLTSGTGSLKASYEPRLRFHSLVPVLRQTSHLLTASLDLPVSDGVSLRASDHFFRGALEANEADPGGEYFFGLSTLTRNEVGAGVRIETGSQVDLDVAGSFNKVRFDGTSNFTSYESTHVAAGLGYEATPTLRLGVSYAYDRVPPSPDRPAIESRAHSVQVSLDGELGALTTGELWLAYRSQKNRGAAAGGESFHGPTLGASLRRDLGSSSSLTMTASRSTPVSAFEGNAFYVSTAVQGLLSFPLPLSFAFTGGAGYRWNTYRTIAPEIGAPREDRIFGLSLGLGRSFTRWSYLRADYRWDRRSSNIPFLSNKTHALVIQLGITPFAGPR